MPGGEPFSRRQQDDIVRAVRQARAAADLAVSVYVGALGEQPRALAQRLHAGLNRPANAVLVAVDPADRQAEIVTGSGLKHRVDDRACVLAAMSMTSAFQVGDLAGGIADGLRILTENARSQRRALTT